MRGLDADHRKQLHEESRDLVVIGHDLEIVWNGQLLSLVIRSLLMRVYGGQTLLAERRRFQARSKLANTEALLAFPLGESSTNRALTRR